MLPMSLKQVKHFFLEQQKIPRAVETPKAFYKTYSSVLLMSARKPGHSFQSRRQL